MRVSLAERVLGVLFFFFGCSPGAVRASLPKRVLGVLFFFFLGCSPGRYVSTYIYVSWEPADTRYIRADTRYVRMWYMKRTPH